MITPPVNTLSFPKNKPGALVVPLSGSSARQRKAVYLLAALGERDDIGAPLYWSENTVLPSCVGWGTRVDVGPYLALVHTDGSLVLGQKDAGRIRVFPFALQFNPFLNGRSGNALVRSIQVANAQMDSPAFREAVLLWAARLESLVDGFAPGQVLPWFRTSQQVPQTLDAFETRLDRFAKHLSLAFDIVSRLSIRSGMMQDWRGTWVLTPTLLLRGRDPMQPAISTYLRALVAAQSLEGLDVRRHCGQFWNWQPLHAAVATNDLSIYRSPAVLDLGFDSRWDKQDYKESLSAHQRLEAIETATAQDPTYGRALATALGTS